ncbi:MAG: DUF664 domain-containing protein [Pirellulales bacterium]
MDLSPTYPSFSLELADALGKIEHCLAQLTDEQVWWHSCESTNSIGNLLLHLAGNLRQWIVSGFGGAADVRDRPSKLAQRGGPGKQELLGRLRSVGGEAKEKHETGGNEGEKGDKSN